MKFKTWIPSALIASIVVVLQTIAIPNPFLASTSVDGSVRSLETHTIIAGESVGPVHLADSRNVVVKYFPLKPIDHETKEPGTRSAILWLDQDKDKVIGDLSFYLKDQAVFQIECASARFKTAKGITRGSEPDSAKRAYRHLSAFLLWNSAGKEVGGRDLIFWVNQERGIAFELYYDDAKHRRLIQHIYIFKSGTNFFPGETWLPAERWREIPPYSLEPPETMQPPPV